MPYPDPSKASVSDSLFSDAFLTEVAQAQRVSQSELAALKLALQNYKSKDIADKLGISEAAARKRLGEVYKKFKIKGRGPGKLAALESHLALLANQQRVPTAAPHKTPRSGVESVQYLADTQGLSSREILPPSSKRTLKESVEQLPTNPDFTTRYHWHDAPELDLFQGRHDDLKLLKRWVLSPATSHKLLAICGIGGIGKTYLALKLAQVTKGHFQQVIWLTAKGNQPPADFFTSLLPLLRPDKQTEKRPLNDSKGSQQLIKQILTKITTQRCLIIIDGFESFFQSRNRVLSFEATPRQQASLYQPGFEAYGDFLEALQRPTEATAKRPASCVILTSREKPREIAGRLAVASVGRCSASRKSP
ncbi:MAG: AAA family ATPase [Cyanobacteria bacterium J06632_3]